MPTPRNSRAALLSAAERLFADRGIAGARTQEIAAAAGVNKALLHYYFDSKEKLYWAVLEHLFAQLTASLTHAFDSRATPRQALYRFLTAYLEFLQTHPSYPRLIQREVMSRGPFLRRVVARYFRPLYRRLAQFLRAGIRQGVFRPVDVHQTAISLIGISVFYFAAGPVLAPVLGGDPYHPARVAARKRAVLDFVRYALLVPAARRAGHAEEL
jgi:TetR/AcrR family transcriptional regulator